jgi:hypothetical protein
MGENKVSAVSFSTFDAVEKKRIFAPYSNQRLCASPFADFCPALFNVEVPQSSCPPATFLYTH